MLERLRIVGIQQPLPPSNIRAEQALLGAILSNNKVMDVCVGLLPEHFADPVHGYIFQQCQRPPAWNAPPTGINRSHTIMAEVRRALAPTLIEFVKDPAISIADEQVEFEALINFVRQFAELNSIRVG